jgi:hypothetical protein
VVVVESPSANLIPPVLPVSAAEPPPDLPKIFRPAKTPDDRAESRRQRRKDHGVRAALKRVLVAAGLRK